jgi:hypothetical protein
LPVEGLFAPLRSSCQREGSWYESNQAVSSVGLALNPSNGVAQQAGGRFGGYGLFLSKGVAGIRRGKQVFLYNLLDLKRTIWSGPELKGGKHTIVFDFKSDGPGLGNGGTGTLIVDGKEVDKESIDHGTPITFSEDETFDVGDDTRTGVAMLEYRYDVPFKFAGKIDKLTFELEPFKPEPQAAAEPRGELGPMEAPEPDPIEEAPKQR